MDADMTVARSPCRNSVAILLMCVVPVAALAQALPDPTRPPDSIFSPDDQQAPRNSGLQSIFISPTRRAAIINGQTVELNGMLGDAKLVEVNESYVVLRSAEGKQVLSMFEGVEKRKHALPPLAADAAAPKMKHKKSLKKNKPAGKHARQVKPPGSNQGDGI